jgi:hypothetical protein
MIELRRGIALPLAGWRLGVVAEWCGFTYRHPALDGFVVGAMCRPHRQQGTPPPRTVLEYNEDDVRAVAVILDPLERLAAGGLTTPLSWRSLPRPLRRPCPSRA